MPLALGVKLMGKVDIGDYTLQVIGLLGPQQFVAVFKKGDAVLKKSVIGYDFKHMVDGIMVGSGNGSEGLARVVIQAPEDVKITNRKKWRFTWMARDQWADITDKQPLVDLIRVVKRSNSVMTTVHEGVYYNRRYGDLLITEEKKLIKAVAVLPKTNSICTHCWNTGKVPQWDNYFKSEVMVPCTCGR